MSCRSDWSSQLDQLAAATDAEAESARHAAPASSSVRCLDASYKTFAPGDAPEGQIIHEGKFSDGVHTHIEATAGDSLNPSMKSFTYGRFEDETLEQISIGDAAAYATDDWDIAFRRYIIRLNSGVSGPGHVQGARTAPGTLYDSLTALPDGLEFASEAYFDDSCNYVDDESGLGSPGTVLSSFWTYTQCVQLTQNVFVLALRGDRFVKLQVLSYYSATNQLVCQNTGMVPSPSVGGHILIRWAYLNH